MKIIITVLILLLIPISASSQGQFFVGQDSELLIGKKMTLKEGISFYSGFYKDNKLKKLLYKKGAGNNPEKLIGLEFIVTDTMTNPNKYNLGKDLVLVLSNEKTGKIYYAYDPKYPELFELNVLGGLTPPDGFLCKRLETEKDKFSSKTIIRTPSTFEYSVSKIEENGAEKIYLGFQSYGTNLTINEKGLKILFSDGTVIEKPNVDIKYKNASGTNGWTYSCLFKLTEDDIDILTTKIITDYSLYIYEREMKSSNSLELREYLKCMTLGKT